MLNDISSIIVLNNYRITKQMIKSKIQIQNLIKIKQNAMPCNPTKELKAKPREIWPLGKQSEIKKILPSKKLRLY